MSSRSYGARNSDFKGRACFNCCQEGHLARECPTGRAGGRICYKCGRLGHTTANCTDQPLPRNTMIRFGACYNCGQEGHLSRDCPRKRYIGGRY